MNPQTLCVPSSSGWSFSLAITFSLSCFHAALVLIIRAKYLLASYVSPPFRKSGRFFSSAHHAACSAVKCLGTRLGGESCAPPSRSDGERCFLPSPEDNPEENPNSLYESRNVADSEPPGCGVSTAGLRSPLPSPLDCGVRRPAESGGKLRRRYSDHKKVITLPDWPLWRLISLAATRESMAR